MYFLLSGVLGPQRFWVLKGLGSWDLKRSTSLEGPPESSALVFRYAFWNILLRHVYDRLLSPVLYFKQNGDQIAMNFLYFINLIRYAFS